jgi:hypothetical protein
VTTTTPGHDEIILTVPGAPDLCNDRAHRNQGRLAQVIVTFGQFGTLHEPCQALWPESWGRSVPLCATCWDTTRQVVQKYRPNLVIHDHTQPAATPTQQP